MRPGAEGGLSTAAGSVGDSFLDRSFNATARKILAGEYHATREESMIATVLGSCVSVCLYDRVRGIGGMNHFMLPGDDDTGRASSSPRYGTHAMDQLYHHLIQLGADPKELEAKVVGAGRVIRGMQDIGRRNADFAVGYLQKRNIRIAAMEIGEIYPRKVLFISSTGQLFVKRLRNRHLTPVTDGQFLQERE